MNTFEQAFKSVLKSMLETAIPNRKIYVSNDLHYKPLDNNPDGIVAVIKSGMGTKSAIAGYNMTTVPISINFILQANYLQELLGALFDISEDDNAEFSTLTVNEINYNYKIVYNDATPLGFQYDEHLKSGTYKLINVAWLLTVVYSQNAFIEPSIFKLKVGTTTYDINYINRYELTPAPAKEPVQYMGDSVQSQNLQCFTYVYSLILLKVQQDPFQTLLRREAIGQSTALSTSNLTLTIDGIEIPITNYSLTESYENNASVYHLTLMR